MKTILVCLEIVERGEVSHQGDREKAVSLGTEFQAMSFA
jgi:hypothetical protein